MRRLLISEHWNEFSQIVLPKDCPAIQRKEMRRAFYAGATGLFFGIMTRLSSDDELTESDMEAILGIEKEIKEFSESVKAGLA